MLGVGLRQEQVDCLTLDGLKKDMSLAIAKYFSDVKDQRIAELERGVVSEKEWSAALDEEVKRLEQINSNLRKEITWRELEIGPPAYWRGSNYSQN